MRIRHGILAVAAIATLSVGTLAAVDGSHWTGTTGMAWHSPARIVSLHGACAPIGVDQLFAEYATESDTTVVEATVGAVSRTVGAVDDTAFDNTMVYTGLTVQVNRVLSGTLVQPGSQEVFVPGGTLNGVTVDTDRLWGLGAGSSAILVLHPGQGLPLVVGNSYDVQADRVILDGKCQLPGALTSQPFVGTATALGGGDGAQQPVNGSTVALSDLQGVVTTATPAAPVASAAAGG